jgi:hypothetical protein
MYLKKHEHILVMLLMNGLSDEKSELQEACNNYLEEAGEYRMVNDFFLKTKLKIIFILQYRNLQ